MKLISFIVFGLFLCFGAYAQSGDEVFCTELIRKSADDSKEVIRLTNKSEIRLNDLLSGDLYQIAFVKDEAKFSLVIKALSEKCFNNDSPVTLFFRDGTKIELPSNNKDNCKSFLSVNLGQAQNAHQIKEHFLEQYLIGIQTQTKEEKVVKLKVGTPQNEMIQELFECIAK